MKSGLIRMSWLHYSLVKNCGHILVELRTFNTENRDSVILRASESPACLVRTTNLSFKTCWSLEWWTKKTKSTRPPRKSPENKWSSWRSAMEVGTPNSPILTRQSSQTLQRGMERDEQVKTDVRAVSFFWFPIVLWKPTLRIVGSWSKIY